MNRRIALPWILMLIIQFSWMNTAESSCSLHVTIDSKSSIWMILEEVEHATSYSVTITPRHSTSTLEFTLNTVATSLTISHLLPDTLYYLQVKAMNTSWEDNSCIAHTHPAPIKVVVGEEPLPDSAMIFVGSNPRVTQWEMELQNGTYKRNWITTEGNFFGYFVEDLIPNTEYQIRARPSHIHGVHVTGTEFGQWTFFTTAMLSIFGRVTLVNVAYDTSRDNFDFMKRLIANGSMQLGNFSDISILEIQNHSSTGFATVHYEIKVFDKSLPVSNDFSLTSELFLESAINNGGRATGTFVWFSSMEGEYEVIYVTENDPYCTIQPNIDGGIRHTSESGKTRIFPMSRFESESSTSCLRSFSLKPQDEAAVSGSSTISNDMDNNTINGIGIVILKEVLLDEPQNESLYTRVYKGVKDITSDEFRKHFYFYKNLESENLLSSNLKYTLSDEGNSATLFVPNIPKSVKYEAWNTSGTLALLTQSEIDGSEFIKITIDNLSANAVNVLHLTVTTRTQDGSNVSAASTLSINTSVRECIGCNSNETCVYNSTGDPICIHDSHNCNGSSECKNTCSNGYHYNGTECEDVNECADNTHNCTGRSECQNTIGSFNCTCEDGYCYNGSECEDVDEYADNDHNCRPTGRSECQNIMGSFNCTCEYGYYYNGLECEDLDECADNIHSCAGISECENTVGGFHCICEDGYYYNGSGCEDVDECADNTHNCTGNSECQNIMGSYKCCCDDGYSYNGTECEDEDECAYNTHNCTGSLKCQNTIGSFNCICEDGYYYNAADCVDVDECAYMTHDCNGTSVCENVLGGFRCICEYGYSYNGIDCYDDNECDENTNSCAGISICENTAGGFICRCEDGFSYNAMDCVDVDECKEATDNCTEGLRCQNKVGGFSCNCGNAKGGFPLVYMGLVAVLAYLTVPI